MYPQWLKENYRHFTDYVLQLIFSWSECLLQIKLNSDQNQNRQNQISNNTEFSDVCKKQAYPISHVVRALVI